MGLRADFKNAAEDLTQRALLNEHGNFADYAMHELQHSVDVDAKDKEEKKRNDTNTLLAVNAQIQENIRKMEATLAPLTKREGELGQQAKKARAKANKFDDQLDALNDLEILAPQINEDVKLDGKLSPEKEAKLREAFDRLGYDTSEMDAVQLVALMRDKYDNLDALKKDLRIKSEEANIEAETTEEFQQNLKTDLAKLKEEAYNEDGSFKEGWDQNRVNQKVEEIGSRYTADELKKAIDLAKEQGLNELTTGLENARLKKSSELDTQENNQVSESSAAVSGFALPGAGPS